MSIKNCIESIHIENIKGYHSKTILLKDNNGSHLLPNKINILIAPNGFGKTSLAVALDLLNNKTNKLDLNNKKEYYFNHDNSLNPKIELNVKLNSEEILSLVADDSKNEIRDYFDIFILNSKLEAKGKGSRYGKATGEMQIKDIFISKVILKQDIEYKYKIISESLKEEYLISNAINLNKTNYLKNISLIKNLFTICEKYSKQNYLKLLKEAINKDEIIDDLLEIKNKFFKDKTTKDFYNILVQFIILYQNNKKSTIKNYIKYREYIELKKNITNILNIIKTFDHNINIKETKRNLIVRFPKANMISNGERDILVFVSQLFYFYSSFINSNKQNALLVIDELFDYLDDANLLIAQYFLVNFINYIKQYNKNTFLMLLTHLDPNYFNTYSFGKYKVFYLDNSKPKVNKDIQKIIKNRSKIKDKNIDKFLHFCIDTEIDISNIFKNYQIKKEFGKRKYFIDFIKKQFINYINSKDYCPISVSIYLRIIIEEYFYNKLQNNKLKEKFLDTFKTVEKLAFVSDSNIEVDEKFYILSPIYNELAHKSYKNLYFKLENKMIRKIISDIYNIIKE